MGTSEDDVTVANRRDLIASLDRAVSHYSKKHNFKTSAVRVVLVLLLILIAFVVASGVYLGVSISTELKGKVTDFGLKNIGELATQAGYFTNVQAIRASRQLFGYDIPLTQSHFIFSYDGVIKAGLDFEQIKVTADEVTKTITVKLPEARILSTEIDENSFEIFDQSNNTFNPLRLEQVNLSLVDLKAKAQQAAIDQGLLVSSRRNAELLIRAFLTASKTAAHYRIVFAEPAPLEAQ